MGVGASVPIMVSAYRQLVIVHSHPYLDLDGGQKTNCSTRQLLCSKGSLDLLPCWLTTFDKDVASCSHVVAV